MDKEIAYLSYLIDNFIAEKVNKQTLCEEFKLYSVYFCFGYYILFFSKSILTLLVSTVPSDKSKIDCFTELLSVTQDLVPSNERFHFLFILLVNCF